MRYRPFGRTGLEVSAMGFGCWPMAGVGYGAIDDSEATTAVRRALDLGVTCFDTAPAYGAGHAEEVLGRALGDQRKNVILVTKCGISAPKASEEGRVRDSRRASILSEVELSLQRLSTDYTDVLLVHWPDPDTSFDVTMRALEDVVASGKARFVGVSNFTVDQLKQCMQVRGVDVVQVGYHMFDRRQERELFPFCAEHGIGVMGYGSLAHGLLSGAFKPGMAFEANDWRASGIAFGQPLFRGEYFQTNLSVVERLEREVARPRGVPLSQVALGWVLRNPVVNTALVGARTPAEVEANAAGAKLDLSQEELAHIDHILRGAAGRVKEFTPLRPAMEQWGDEITGAES
jgi:aryl-alcohol dehydrogenase-like predicted oxidoreductase